MNTAPQPEVDPLDDEGLPFNAVPNRGRGELLRSDTRSRRQEAARWRQILNSRTRPWEPDEFIYLDGIPCVYRILPAYGTVVALPGGSQKFLRDMWIARKHIQGPWTIRLDDVYTTPPNRRNEK